MHYMLNYPLFNGIQFQVFKIAKFAVITVHYGLKANCMTP